MSASVNVLPLYVWCMGSFYRSIAEGRRKKEEGRSREGFSYPA
ncbi:hypothetical protein [Okeania sp. SIO3B5]|nr:hypothetical protein [Okeania sp. SIO3B5]